MTSRKATNIIKKNKNKKSGQSFFKMLIKLIIWSLIGIGIVYSAYKYNLLPQKINSFENLTGLFSFELLKDKFLKQSVAIADEKASEISNYSFEYKFWALSYADSGESEEETSQNTDEEKESPKKQSSDDKKEKVTENVYVMPSEGKIGSGFGPRIPPVKGSSDYHKGIDLEALSGAPVKAFYKGEVIFAGFEKTFGNYIKISHNNELSSLYAHCSKLIVKKGQKVSTGEIIGYVGSTGIANGPHLHFEIHKNNVAVDPLSILGKK